MKIMKSKYSDGKFYEANVRYNPFISQMVEKLNQGTVVDFGCGAGTNIRHLVRLGWKAYAVDIEPLAVRKARSILPSDRVFLSGIEDFDFNKIPDVELVLCNYVFQHMSYMEIERFLKRISKKVKPNGHFILSFFKNRGNISFSDVTVFFEKNNWEILQKKEWYRKDIDHGASHIHEGLESFWRKL